MSVLKSFAHESLLGSRSAPRRATATVSPCIWRILTQWRIFQALKAFEVKHYNSPGCLACFAPDFSFLIPPSRPSRMGVVWMRKGGGVGGASSPMPAWQNTEHRACHPPAVRPLQILFSLQPGPLSAPFTSHQSQV